MLSLFAGSRIEYDFVMVLRCSLLGAAACVIACGPPQESQMPLPPPPVAEYGPDASATTSTTSADAGASGPVRLSSSTFTLPGAKGAVTVDYTVADRPRGKVWIPVAETGSVAIFDAEGKSFSHVDGFKNAQRESNGKKSTAGANAVTMGEGFAFVGNRATNEVCAIDMQTDKLAGCVKLPSQTDGVAYVAAAKELWVTMPRDRSIAIVDATKADKLKLKTTVKLAGAPEGYAVDDAHALFFTNLEDKDKTVAIDVKSHTVKSTWAAGCGSAGPRGLAVDGAQRFVIVACPTSVRVLDAGEEGAELGKLEAGEGIDNVDFLPSVRLVYIAAADSARLTVARLDDKGSLKVVATGATALGARSAVADGDGTAYVVDPANAKLVVLPLPSSLAP